MAQNNNSKNKKSKIKIDPLPWAYWMVSGGAQGRGCPHSSGLWGSQLKRGQPTISVGCGETLPSVGVPRAAMMVREGLLGGGLEGSGEGAVPAQEQQQQSWRASPGGLSG